MQTKVRSDGRLAILSTAIFISSVQPYLDALPPSHRFAFVRLRFGETFLGITRGRHTSTPRAERYCRWCCGAQRPVEDHYHVFGRCLGNSRIYLARWQLASDLRALPAAESGLSFPLRLSLSSSWDALLHSAALPVIRLVAAFAALVHSECKKTAWKPDAVVLARQQAKQKTKKQARAVGPNYAVRTSKKKRKTAKRS